MIGSPTVNLDPSPAQIQSNGNPIAVAPGNGGLVNLFNVSESATVVNCDFLSINDSDGPSVRQIKSFTWAILRGWFSEARGPIFPYLFLLVMDGFHAFLNKKIEAGPFLTLQRCFRRFPSLPGLQPNLQKSEIFFSGVTNDDKAVLKSILPIPEEALPVKYLGVPLITTRLKYGGCMLLKEKILQRINSWASRLLSYEGRAQLIQCLLFSIQVYWCSLFILPQRMLKEIDGLLRDVLWSGAEMKQTGAKVQWYIVCTTNTEGGLGFMLLREWNRNKATMIRHSGAISSKTDSLWVKWIHTYTIADRNLWYMALPHGSSWTVKKLFKLRQRNRWIQQIIAHTPADLVPNALISDRVVWLPVANGMYTTKSAWNEIRRAGNAVLWHQIVWYKHNVPKWAFIERLCCHKKLATKDRLRGWGMAVDPMCILCNEAEEETHNHLFFECRYASGLWLFKYIAYKTTLAAAIYHLWRERNARVFSQQAKDLLTLLRKIETDTRDSLNSWTRVVNSQINWLLCIEWSISTRILDSS
ncbi:hypothetical protein Acr_00g0020450 [Actinidia rufa]|uniref:Reverse transcriptase zinc-binding domain-containing protein n=1 Tax=Actinidia rufa TaxID=165716 RepID=A0A7J0DDT7_9ERIC|nr:hypothetical protein Acr_00g0020450 [Actinidia rufa]